ncbi:MAG TPA: ABC transporter substrate-binding protein [Oscillatoriaceae cyanobacterium]
MRKILLHLSIGLTLCGLSGCFLLPPDLAGNTDTIKLGVISPGSGTDAGDAVFNGAQLAVDQINAAGGVLGKKVSLIYADDQSDATKAPGKAMKLVTQGVLAIIGDSTSSASTAVLAQVAKPSQCVMVSPASTSPALTDPAKTDTGGYFYRTVASDSLQGKALAQRALDAGYKTLAILNVDNAYGNGLAEVLKTTFEAQPGHTTFEQTYSEEPVPKPSYSDIVVPLLQKKPDAIVLIGYPGGGSQIIKDWITSGIAPQMPWLFSEALEQDSFVANVNNPSRLEGLTGTAPYNSGDNYNRFVQDFETTYKIPPGPYAVNAYDAAVLIAFALERGQALTRDAVKQNILAVSAGAGQVVNSGADGIKAGLEALASGQQVNYEGASGSVDLTASGDVTSGSYVVWKITGGKIQLTDQVLTP